MRPQGIYDNILLQRELDGRSFYEQHGTSFIDIGCPACGGHATDAFKKYGFNHRICTECKTLYCSPRPDESLLAEYYNSFNAPRMWTELLLSADTERKAIQYQPRVRQLLQALEANGKRSGGVAIDVGAGSGAFSLCLQQAGFFDEVIALDLSRDCIEKCKKAGLKTHHGTVDGIQEGSVDFIATNDLLEHLYDPGGFLRTCRKSLKRDGFISIATPNGEGFDFKILKSETKNITPPEHLTYFNTRSIVMLLEKNGFEAILVETPGILDVDIVLRERKAGNQLAERNEYIDFLLNAPEDVRRSFQDFLVRNRLSSHMLVLAKRK